MILNNRRIALREIADNVDISFGSCQAIFMDALSTKHAPAKIVPKLLNCEQKQLRIDVVQDILTTFNNDPDLLQKVITCDKSWVYF